MDAYMCSKITKTCMGTGHTSFWVGGHRGLKVKGNGLGGTVFL